MIVTVTPNPSVDRTLRVDRLIRGGIMRATANHVHPSGKGVNVARALLANGYTTKAVLPIGGAEGRQLADLLNGEGIDFAAVPIQAAVRANISVVEPDGCVTKINEGGPALSADEVERLIAMAADLAGQARWVVGSGSLPPGAPAGFYADLIQRLQPSGASVAIDSSGSPLVQAAGQRPALIKPNVAELAGAVNRPVRTLGQVLDAAQELRSLGARTVLVSMGADGALLAGPRAIIHGEAPVSMLRSAVGAGDALLAGFLAAGGQGADALAQGLAWAAAACEVSDSRVAAVSRHSTRPVTIHDEVDRQRQLQEPSEPSFSRLTHARDLI